MPALTPVQTSPTVHLTAAGDITATLATATTAGNTLVACINANGSTANPVATSATLGGVADHWQQAVANNPAVQSDAQIWYDPNCAGGQTSVVVHFGTAGSGTIDEFLTVYEVPGVLTADKTISANSSAATTFTSGATATTVRADEIFFGALISASTTVPVATGAGTWTTQSGGGSGRWQLAGFQVVAATGTATYSGTQASATYSVAVATFFATGGGGSSGQPLAPGWHPGYGLPGLPGGTPFWSPPGGFGDIAAGGAATITATATIAAAGAVTAAVTQAVTAAPAGAGALSAVITQAVIAAPAATGTVTAVVTEAVTATLAGAGAAGPVPVTEAVIASPAGAGAVTDVVTQIVTASLAGAGAVTASVAGAGSTATIAGAGAVTALATQAVTATLAGAGTVTASVTEAAKATLAGAGAVSASGQITGTANLAGAGSVTALVVQAAVSTPAAAGAVSGAAGLRAPAALAGAGAVTAASTSAASTVNATSAPTVADPRDGTARVSGAVHGGSVAAQATSGPVVVPRGPGGVYTPFYSATYSLGPPQPPTVTEPASVQPSVSDG